MLTSEQLAEWWRLADAATPGPLTHHGNHVYSEKDADLQRHAFFEDAADAALYVAARSAVPALLDEVERLRGELAGAQGTIANRRTIWRNGGASDRTMARLAEAFHAYDAALAEQRAQS